MKYAALKTHLEELTGNEWNTSFQQIERILGSSLPKSARLYPAWWANQANGPQSSAWQDAGWKTNNLNLTNERITFERTGVVKKPKKLKPSSPEVVAKKLSWDSKEQLVASLVMEWEPLGSVYFDKSGRLSFPDAPKQPGLYRFRIRLKGKPEARYIGESVNIHTRFNQNYRHGNVRQHTSHRMNRALKDALHNGAEISVSIITEKAWIKTDGTKIRADLSSKAVRRLFEQFAQCIIGDCVIETLNR